VPLQHLTGTVGFARFELAVGPGAFVPRPETELLAQWAVGTGGGVVIDLGSGTGALALAIAHELPTARVYAVERSPAALRWLRRNAADRAAAGDRPVEVVAGDATDPAVLAELDGTVDLVVCNPPYVPGGVPVPPEVADHDPPEAVFGGPDGLAVIRPVIARAAALLRPGGWFGLEHDESHADAVAGLLRDAFTRIADHRDLAGRPRYVTAARVAD
jgi:release factor glutamine methyltransferase